MISGQTKATRSKSVKNVRRHACCSLVKICKTYPDLLLPGFNELYTHIKQLSSNPEQLSQMEKTTLLEALILISNRFHDFQKQSDFIGEILGPVKVLFFRFTFYVSDVFSSFSGGVPIYVNPSSTQSAQGVTLHLRDAVR